jgi:acetylornithine deacetylase/succinyl-diaminopimelate desuccinylase-like protein
VDLRSTDETALRRLSERVTRLTAQCSRKDSVEYELEPMGERPAGLVAIDSPIVTVAAQALRILGVEPGFDASSTDANVPIAAGLPAICIGLTSGGNVHRIDEYIDVAPVATGLAQLALSTIAITELLAARSLTA